MSISKARIESNVIGDESKRRPRIKYISCSVMLLDFKALDETV